MRLVGAGPRSRQRWAQNQRCMACGVESVHPRFKKKASLSDFIDILGTQVRREMNVNSREIIDAELSANQVHTCTGGASRVAASDY